MPPISSMPALAIFSDDLSTLIPGVFVLIFGFLLIFEVFGDVTRPHPISSKARTPTNFPSHPKMILLKFHPTQGKGVPCAFLGGKNSFCNICMYIYIYIYIQYTNILYVIYILYIIFYVFYVLYIKSHVQLWHRIPLAGLSVNKMKSFGYI